MPNNRNQYTRQIDNVAVIYNIYRIVLPLILMTTYVSNASIRILGDLDATLFVQVNTFYALFGVINSFVTSSRREFNDIPWLQFLLLLTDITAIILLVYSCGGMSSGLGVLLIVTVASASILTRSRFSILITAIAIMAMFGCEFYLSLTTDSYTNQFLQVGILGTILFVISFYIQSVNTRAYRAAILAEEQASSIVDLEKLNDEIIKRMRTGVLIVKSNNEIVVINNAARRMLQPLLMENRSDGEDSNRLPNSLLEQLNTWRNNTTAQSDPITIPGSNSRIHTNFTFLNESENADVIVFVEDQGRIMQRIKQTRLASLGRLTASIAHEVRNPLGAISHASQVMKESGSESTDNQRMLEIIINHCNRINNIIQDVLNASRHKDIPPDTIELETWLRNFINRYQESQQKCDEIRYDATNEKVVINVIADQLERVLINLFENGLRYSEKATGRASLLVRLGIKTDMEGEKQPFIDVIDEGPGLKDEAESHLFEPFHTTEPTGTGLGLYISKELCEANHASLEYSVTDTGTSCFSIYFSNSSHGSI